MLLTSTPITIGSAAHVLHGNLSLAGDRIQERLNDINSDMLKLTNVEIRSHLQAQCVATLETALVPKSRIEYVLVSSDQHEAPTKRWNNHTRKVTHASTAVLSTCCIKGEIHLTETKVDALYSIAHALPGFFALTNASIRILGASPIEVPLAFANRDNVTCLQIGDMAAQDLAEVMKPANRLAAVGT